MLRPSVARLPCRRAPSITAAPVCCPPLANPTMQANHYTSSRKCLGTFPRCIPSPLFNSHIRATPCAEPLTCASFPASQCQPGQIYRPNKPCVNGRCTSSQCCEGANARGLGHRCPDALWLLVGEPMTTCARPAALRCSNYTGGCGTDGFAVDPSKPCTPAGCNEATCCVSMLLSVCTMLYTR
jgi:hypothetical protein